VRPTRDPHRLTMCDATITRGLGLAYSFSLYGDSEEGLVYFSLSRSNSLSRAYSIAGKIVRSFASG
jgi:hypothetical protein